MNDDEDLRGWPYVGGDALEVGGVYSFLDWDPCVGLVHGPPFIVIDLDGTHITRLWLDHDHLRLLRQARAVVAPLSAGHYYRDHNGKEPRR